MYCGGPAHIAINFPKRQVNQILSTHATPESNPIRISENNLHSPTLSNRFEVLSQQEEVLNPIGPVKKGVIWLDSPRSVQLVSSSGSISSKEVSKVFSTQVEVSTLSQHQVHVLALLDSGAKSCFMDREFVLSLKISLRKLPYPASAVVIDGRPIASGNIT